MDNQLPPRERILNAIAELLEAQGYHATGLNEIVAHSGAPKGSLYHYFPGGKEEIAAEAIERKAREGQQHIQRVLAAHEDPAEAVRTMILTMVQYMRSTDCRTGGVPITAVAMETASTNERLRLACAEAYAGWRKAVRDKLLASQYSPEKAEQLAILVSSAIEGAMIQSRVNRDTKYLESIAESLAKVIRAEAG